MNIFRVLSPAIACAALMLAACQPGTPADNGATASEAPPLQGAKIGGPFALTDQDGKLVIDADFAGKYRIMYFGYTFCPDVCPTDMQTVGAALTMLDKSDPALSKRIVPIFVSIDPARDTPPVLKQFVSAFYPRMVGLTGSAAAIDKVAKEYAVYYAKGDPAPGGGYLMNHSRQAYLMNPAGKPLALLPTEQGATAVAAEIERWAK